MSEVTVHECCGCSCHVCDDGHQGGEHTRECERRIIQEATAVRLEGDLRRALQMAGVPDEGIEHIVQETKKMAENFRRSDAEDDV